MQILSAVIRRNPRKWCEWNRFCNGAYLFHTRLTFHQQERLKEKRGKHETLCEIILIAIIKLEAKTFSDLWSVSSETSSRQQTFRLFNQPDDEMSLKAPGRKRWIEIGTYKKNNLIKVLSEKKAKTEFPNQIAVGSESINALVLFFGNPFMKNSFTRIMNLSEGRLLWARVGAEGGRERVTYKNKNYAS